MQTNISLSYVFMFFKHFLIIIFILLGLSLGRRHRCFLHHFRKDSFRAEKIFCTVNDLCSREHMTVISVKEIKIPYLITEPLMLHHAIVCRVVIKPLIPKHDPAVHLHTLCREIVGCSVYHTLASGNTSVSRCQIVGAALIGKPSSYQIACSVKIISGIIINGATIALIITKAIAILPPKDSFFHEFISITKWLDINCHNWFIP